MTTIDFRNETFASIQNRISGSRAAVLTAWTTFGPCTTEQLAERSRISILSLRPRTTELVQLGFVCLADDQVSGLEGTYRVRSQAEHAAWVSKEVADARNPQRELNLK